MTMHQEGPLGTMVSQWEKKAKVDTHTSFPNVYKGKSADLTTANPKRQRRARATNNQCSDLGQLGSCLKELSSKDPASSSAHLQSWSSGPIKPKRLVGSSVWFDFLVNRPYWSWRLLCGLTQAGGQISSVTQLLSIGSSSTADGNWAIDDQQLQRTSLWPV